LQNYEKIKLIPANWTAVQKEIIKPPTYTSGNYKKYFAIIKLIIMQKSSEL